MSPDYQGAFALPPGATAVMLVRHGSSAQYDPDAPFPLVGGQSDPPLAPRGLEQARAIADGLGGEPLVAVFITPLRRTAQTAAPLADQLGLEPIVVPELREVHLGDWETGGGFGVSRPDRDAVRRRVLEEEEWGLIPGAETVDSLGQRVAHGLETVASQIGPDAVGAAIVHGGVITEACHQITASRPFAFFGPENASITRVVRDSAGRWTLRSFNETGHLR
ncbi:MAG TPA: histidine phosphatase family protein [Solirubrobacteraceae bacterium]